jgi:hypothetical protein
MFDWVTGMRGLEWRQAWGGEIEREIGGLWDVQRFERPQGDWEHRNLSNPPNQLQTCTGCHHLTANNNMSNIFTNTTILFHQGLLWTNNVLANGVNDNSLPASWSRLTSLTKIEIHNVSGLTNGDLPPSWSTLKNLVEISVTGSALGQNSMLPASWSALQQLEVLQVRDKMNGCYICAICICDIISVFRGSLVGR